VSREFRVTPTDMPTTHHEPTGEALSRPADHQSIPQSWPLPLFTALVTISVAVWWTALVSLMALALGDEQYTHILLILPVSATLIFLEWKPAAVSTRFKPTLGFALLILATALNLVVRWRVLQSTGAQLSLSILVLVMWWLAAFNFCFGAGAFRRALFSLCFLFWMVPLPSFVLNSIVTLLQQGSAASAHLLFAAIGIPVAQRGMLVHIPGLTLQVAPECSSIRSSMMLMVTTMVLVHLLLGSSWRRIVVVSTAIPLSVAKNGLRIFALGVLATRVNPSFLTGRLHRQGGIVFFLIALAAIFLLIWILRRSETINRDPSERFGLKEDA
jgi:exosortase